MKSSQLPTPTGVDTFGTGVRGQNPGLEKLIDTPPGDKLEVTLWFSELILTGVDGADCGLATITELLALEKH